MLLNSLYPADNALPVWNMTSGDVLRRAAALAPNRTALVEVVPDEYKQDAHHWLILHGRYVCKARKPDCARCVVADLCRHGRKLIAKGALPSPGQDPA